MEKRILRPSHKSLYRAIAGCIFTTMLLAICISESIHNGKISWLFVAITVIMILYSIYCIRYALRQIRQSIILDSESMTLYDCAAKMENDTMRVDVGTVTLKWSDITGIEQRLIRTISGETYSDGAVYGSKQFNPKTKASPFGEKGWVEIVRYYNNSRQN